ncbi:MAG: squalene/phytoene synthase family protein [Chloroflexi bacterium]|nr:squalene/phytoene synthase family protein [Chloroflexota bacterium]
MTVHSSDWENHLLSLADRAYDSPITSSANHIVDAGTLAKAYAHCEAITASNSRSFYLASGLLTGRKRIAARVLYAFCRISDNIVDEPKQDPVSELAQWREITTGTHPDTNDPVAQAWSHVRQAYAIPHIYAEQLIDGVATDLVKARYASFNELAAYAYSVASTVGLMSMHIIGYTGEEAIPYAIRLGVALQLTNILRDVGEDWENGRVYLPQDELARFGLSDEDIAHGQVDDRWRAFMAFQIERTRKLYRENWPGIAMLEADGRLAIGAAARFYERILDDIETHDYDVFNRRAHVSGLGKLRMLPAIWAQTRSL